MKIIQALKQVKADRHKINDLTNRIRENSAHMESSKPVYDKPAAKIKEWVQSIHDTQSNINALLIRIAKTNLATTVTIEIGGKQITKSIAEWIIRRREGVDADYQTWAAMTDCRLKANPITLPDGTLHVDQVVRNFDPSIRDDNLAILSQEKSLIDSHLEIVNATTDLLD